MNDESLTQYLAARVARINGRLASSVPAETEAPATLHRAMRYSLLEGGKRLRPLLVLAAGEACGASEETLLPVACALELIHTYSLIHDDLPSMDNDDLRRGRPTSHRVFGEALAILAGDALLTQAFLLLAQAPVPDSARVALVSLVADAAGPARGMAGGQVMDLQAEGQQVTLDEVEAIHRAKTGALIRASVIAGGIAAGASNTVLEALRGFGDRIGLAFQIVDDLLDISASSEELGKTAGKDVSAGKATFPSLLGVEAATVRADGLLKEALAALAPLGPASRRLQEIARLLVERRA